jgi:catechol 2,3-dioxygenase-like lactoylglutathione lyase family enzyme
MPLTVGKPAIDIGIVVRDPQAMLRFYRDVLELPFIAEVAMSGGMTMYRLRCGETVVKLVAFAKVPEAAAAPGGLSGATGIRYFTITVPDLEAVVARCRDAGCRVPVAPREIRPGVSICMVEDPDGNWVEFLKGG